MCISLGFLPQMFEDLRGTVEILMTLDAAFPDDEIFGH